MEPLLSNFALSNRLDYRIYRHVVFWICWLLFHTLIYSGFWKGAGEAYFYGSFVEALIFMPIHIFLSYAIIYFLFPRFVFKGKYFSALIGFIILLVITAGLSHLFARTFIVYFRNAIGVNPISNTLVYGLMAGLRGSNTVAGFAAAIKLVKYWYFKKTEIERLENEKLKAELDVLKGQLQPHFLFNTLNNLYSLILSQSKEAPEVVLKLSELLRYILTGSAKSKISLTEELSILKDYIALERIRFGSRLDLTLNLEGDTENKLIAPLILLPFVENAFKHGANQMLEQPWVCVDIAVRDQRLKFKLVNGKCAITANSAVQASGIGLQNVRKRLELLYPGRHELKTSSHEESYVINLQMELESA